MPQNTWRNLFYVSYSSALDTTSLTSHCRRRPLSWRHRSFASTVATVARDVSWTCAPSTCWVTATQTWRSSAPRWCRAGSRTRAASEMWIRLNWDSSYMYACTFATKPCGWMDVFCCCVHFCYCVVFAADESSGFESEEIWNRAQLGDFLLWWGQFKYTPPGECDAPVWAIRVLLLLLGNGQAEMREKSTGLDYHFITEPIRRRR